MKPVRIRQPIHSGNNFPPHQDSGDMDFILRPAAFFWYAGQLYVGYAYLSCLHHDEEPCWDPVPVPLGATIDASLGYYSFKEVIQGQGRRSFAVLESHDLDRAHWYNRPRKNGSWYLQITDQTPRLCERFVLEPGMVLKVQRRTSSIPLLLKTWGGRDCYRRVQRSPSMEAMRNVDPKLRKEMETLYPTNMK